MMRNFVYPGPYAADPTDTPAQIQGKRIKYWRDQKKWTQEDLAHAVGMTFTSISTLERGAQKNSGKLVEIAAALGINYQHLKTGKGDPQADVAIVELVSDKVSPLPPELTDELGALEPAEQRLAFYEFKEVIDKIKALRRGRKQG